MVREETKKKFSELLDDESFVRQYIELEDPVEMTNLFAENGLDVPVEELKELLEETLGQLEKIPEEMTESQMESVTGGVLGWIALGGVVAVGTGYFMYRARAHFNHLRGKCG